MRARFALTVLNIVGDQYPAICKDLFRLSLGHRIFFGALEAIAVVPVKSDDLAELKHYCILS